MRCGNGGDRAGAAGRRGSQEVSWTARSWRGRRASAPEAHGKPSLPPCSLWLPRQCTALHLRSSPGGSPRRGLPASAWPRSLRSAPYGRDGASEAVSPRSGRVGKAPMTTSLTRPPTPTCPGPPLDIVACPHFAICQALVLLSASAGAQIPRVRWVRGASGRPGLTWSPPASPHSPEGRVRDLWGRSASV